MSTEHTEPQEADDNLALQGNTETQTSVDGDQGEQTQWWYDKDVAGVGEKPEWYNSDKYETLSAQAQAYQGAAGKLRGFSGAPETYDLTLSKEFTDQNLKVDADDSLVKTITGWAKDQNMTQAALSELINTYVSHQQSAAALTETADAEFNAAEIEKLGDGGAELLDTLKTWGKNTLPPELLPTFKAMAATAEAVRVFDFLKQKTRYATVPTNNSAGRDLPSHAELQTMMADTRYGSDQVYTKEVDASYAKAFG